MYRFGGSRNSAFPGFGVSSGYLLGLSIVPCPEDIYRRVMVPEILSEKSPGNEKSSSRQVNVYDAVAGKSHGFF